MPYHRDGTVVVTSAYNQYYTAGATTYPNGSQITALNSSAVLVYSTYAPIGGPLSSGAGFGWWWFFPEQREITGLFVGYITVGLVATPVVAGSADSTNGLDGTWETGSVSGTLWPGDPGSATQLDKWRSSIRAVSFTGGKRVLRMNGSLGGGGSLLRGTVIHIYGKKTAGQTPNDLIFIDHDTTPGAEFQAPEDFGDRPLDTSVVRQFRIKNASATLTANSLNLQCNDADFAISENGTTWVTTINIASLAAGAESATMYTRNTTPAAGNPLGPRFAEIVALVGSWT
jgi:hypothetical protein